MTEKSKELTITKTYSLDKPAEVVAMATVLKNYIMKQELFTNISGKNYAHVDGWQFAGFLSGMNAIVEEPKNLSTGNEIKWSATAKIYIGDKVVGIGYALCSNKENKKKTFDEYAILSMAQTRALGKAYRNKIGWIMKLAGYNSTPYEEIAKTDGQPVAKYQPKAAVKPQTPSKPAISDLIRLKDKLNKMGARNAKEAIELYNEISGENIKSLAVGPARAKEMLFQILNSPLLNKKR